MRSSTSLAGWLVLGFFACLNALVLADAKPNILFIASDDMRPQLGCYGDKLAKSPNLDHLAARGLLFENAYCQQALCSPSRISLLSGRHIWTTKIDTIGPTLRSKLPDVVTLPQHFKNSGYFTQSLGKIFHIGIDDPASWSVKSWVTRAPRYGPTGQKLVQAKRKRLVEAGEPVPDKGPGAPYFAGPAFEAPDCADDDLWDGDTARYAVERIRELAKDPNQPFFLAVGFSNPHVPWVAPKKYFDLYKLEEITLPENRYAPRGAPVYAAKSGDDFYWYANVPKDRKIQDAFGRECLRGYLAAISYVDAQVGRLLAALEETGLSKNTIVIFWGDHGYYMGEHDWWGGKHNNYEGATRAPLMIAVPGMKTPGIKTRALVEFVDIYPSLCELAGLKLTDGLEGTSFVPLLSDPAQPWKKAAFSEYPKGGYHGIAMRTARYRYVQWINKSGIVVSQELYDHQTDPQENRNIAGEEANAEVLKQLKAEMEEKAKGKR